ncbi:T9SS type B sorting domain-containing protein [Flavobacterium zepuense]|uniref:T9SS type B sorting domain-containing protein n=1 Tax=Flavobacterium zepuense TaxID=2593302 RepID=A0A552VAN0_9FLAO|nr:T9SS type B sorting domain-containing protein [Flavobacterium zepuense]TRW27410.1 T9SS type B sorting domain-containing protein [Flavobacterium zepuense]
MKYLNNKTFAHDAILGLHRSIFILIFLLSGTALWAQALTLTVNATNQTCPGNGSLAFVVQNAQPNVPVIFTVYNLPDTTNPIYVGPNTSLPGQSAGNYKVVATQQGQPPSEANATIGSNLTPLTYTIEGTSANCGNDGIFTINVTSGNAVSYQISSGPVTVAPQPSNVFNNLPAGSYTIKVTDNCGTSVVIAQTLFSNSPVLAISPPQFPDIALPDCDHITISNSITHSNDLPINYPLTIAITVYPPGGGTPVIFNQTVTAGDPDTQAIQQIIPFYYDTDYYYDITVTDPCGTPYSLTNNLVRQQMFALGTLADAGCGQKLIVVIPTKYVGPYTITFVNPPAGFDPVAFNENYPGPFYGETTVFGEDGNAPPVGIYEFYIEDACGRTSSPHGLIEIVAPDVEPIGNAINLDCEDNLGELTIEVPSYILESVVITTAPAEYFDLYPGQNDISGNIIDDGTLEMGGLPPGEYHFTVQDTCGTVYTPDLIVQVPNYTTGQPSLVSRPDCVSGLGTLSIGHASAISSVIMTIAPPGFDQTLLPYDVSSNINSNGDFYMAGMLPGNYNFTIVTNCQTFTKPVGILGYSVTSNNVTHIPLCGTFNVDVQHTANSIAGVSYWLQKEIDATNDIWGHPVTGELFTGIYNAASAQALILGLNDNLPLYDTGHYRVMKTYRAFLNGSEGGNDKTCAEQLYDFNYYNTLVILGAESLTCSGTMADVQINAEGVTPLTFTITEKNGMPFTINNGSNNVFTNLDNATYTVYVSDPCGNSEPLTFNIADLPSLVSASIPPDLYACAGDGSGTGVFDLTQQDAAVLNVQDPSLYTVTYHSSLNDATTGANPLPLILTTASTMVYARVQYVANPSCVATSAFYIEVKNLITLSMQDEYRACEGENITITADPGYTSYVWSTGQTGQSISVTQPGAYTVTVSDAFQCPATKTVNVFVGAAPVISSIEVVDWTDHNNIITVIMEQNSNASIQNFEYSINGIDWQQSNVFTGLDPGKYEVYVRDANDCGNDGGIVYLLSYPKYFTPNGDGENETWRIKFSTAAEPGLIVYIYDRYGKLLTGFGANDVGWDGTYNGAVMPSTDYWFVVKRQNGKECRGHFAMIR